MTTKNSYKAFYNQDDVDHFNSNWPASEVELPEGKEQGWFEFDSNGDLVDHDAPMSSDYSWHAFSLDCQAKVNHGHAVERGWRNS